MSRGSSLTMPRSAISMPLSSSSDCSRSPETSSFAVRESLIVRIAALISGGSGLDLFELLLATATLTNTHDAAGDHKHHSGKRHWRLDLAKDDPANGNGIDKPAVGNDGDPGDTLALKRVGQKDLS